MTIFTFLGGLFNKTTAVGMCVVISVCFRTITPKLDTLGTQCTAGRDELALSTVKLDATELKDK